MLPLDHVPTYETRLTEHEYAEKYQVEKESAQFESLRRKWRATGATFEAVQRTADWAGFLPDVFFQQILEGTQYRDTARQIANVYTAPEGWPTLHYREFERWQEAQIVGDDDELEAHKGETKIHSLPFVTIGDRVGYTWASLKDLPIDQTGLDMRAMGAMIAMRETQFVMDALYNATSGDNATTYNNATTIALTAGTFDFVELLKWKARMEAPTGESHPDLTEVQRRALCNMYSATTCVVPPRVYESIVTDKELMASAFWAGSKILDSGAISTVFGMTIHRTNVGYFDAKYGWTPIDSIYLLDTTLGGVDLVFKEPLQLVDWPTNENRRQNMMVYERLNAIVRNRRSIYRLELEDDGYA